MRPQLEISVEIFKLRLLSETEKPLITFTFNYFSKALLFNYFLQSLPIKLNDYGADSLA